MKVLEPGDPAPEVLYWVGCAASFDERAKKSAESTAKLLQKAGVDFAILGPREACTGDPARRMGNEYVFQAFAEQNVSTLNEAGVTKIVASCPHCFNTLANEYGDFGGNYEVMHHTELLAELVRDGKLEPKAGASSRSRTTTPVTSPATTTCAWSRASSSNGGRSADRDEAERQADVLLRRRRRAHVDGGARHGRSTRSARARRRRRARRRSRSRARSAR